MRNDEGKKERLPLYYDGENVQGKVINLKCIIQYMNIVLGKHQVERS